MNKFIRFDVEIPRLVAIQLNTEDDFEAFLLSFTTGQQKLINSLPAELSTDEFDNEVEKFLNADNLKVMGDKLVQETYSDWSPNIPIRRVVARSGDYAIWNQKNEVHIVFSTAFDKEWSDDLIPNALLLPVARRKVI